MSEVEPLYICGHCWSHVPCEPDGSAELVAAYRRESIRTDGG